MRRGRGSLTARLTAACRALGPGDPYAARFAGPRLAPWLSMSRRVAGPINQISLGLVQAVQARHAWIDQRLERAVANGATQVVLLGAGFDSRPWRLDLGAARWFVCDHPDTARARAGASRELPPRGAAVSVDFACADFGEALLGAGFQPEAPAVFVWEGVSMYLPVEAVRATLQRIHSLGGAVVFDAWCSQPAGLQAPLEALGRHALGWLGEPLRWTPPTVEVDQVLREVGLSVSSRCRCSQVAGFGRAHPGLALFDAGPAGITPGGDPPARR